jgi:hypothetical protein
MSWVSIVFVAIVETKKEGNNPLHIRLLCSPQPPHRLGGCRNAIKPVCIANNNLVGDQHGGNHFQSLYRAQVESFSKAFTAQLAQNRLFFSID